MQSCGDHSSRRAGRARIAGRIACWRRSAIAGCGGHGIGQQADAGGNISPHCGWHALGGTGVIVVGVGESMRSRAQMAAIANVRWQIFVHSLRSKRGALELFSRIVIGVVITCGGLGGALLLGVGAWSFVSEGKPDGLALLLWPVFLFWQLFPIMATALTES